MTSSPFVKEAYAQAGPNALGWSGASDEVIAELASEGAAKRIMNIENILFAKETGRVLGFASWKELDSEIAELSGVIVLESEKGKGVGSALMGRVLREIRDKGCSKVVVKTEENNETAVSFYEKFCFVPKRLRM